MKTYSHASLYPNKPQKGKDATKQTKRHQKCKHINPQRENTQEHGKDLDLSMQAWIQTQKHGKEENKAQTCKKELIQTLY